MPQFPAGTGIPLRPNGTSRDAKPVPPDVKIRNRRRKYLETHPDYLNNPELELADPLLWDRLIRRFQSAAEREAEGKRKGFSGILEADILRGEAKTEALQHPDAGSLFTYKRGPDGEILAEEKDEVPLDKSDGMQRWRLAMETRFVRGADDDFDYREVDENEAYDDHKIEEQEAADKYFDEEEPEFVEKTKSRELQGETGIQDF